MRSLHARWKTGEGWLRVIGGAGERWWSGDVKWQMRVEGRGIQGQRGGRGEMVLRVGRCGMVDARGGIRDEGVGMRDGECEVVGDEDGRRLIGGVGERWWSDDAKCRVRDVGRWMRNGGWARGDGVGGWELLNGGCEMGVSG